MLALMMAGTDTNALLPAAVAVIFGAAAVFTGGTMWWTRTEATRQTSSLARVPSTPERKPWAADRGGGPAVPPPTTRR